MAGRRSILSASFRSVAAAWPEWRWAFVVAVIAAAAIELPYLLAYSQAASGHVFVGMLWTPQDFAQYGAAMREGAASPSWLVHDHLSGEPHRPVLMYAFYVALGKLAGGTGADVQSMYHASEVIARMVPILAMYAFAAAVLPSVATRRLALLLMAFSTGLGPLLLLGAGLVGLHLDVRISELKYPELSTPLVFFTAPHVALGLALLLLVARCYVVAWSGRSTRSSVAAGPLTLALGLVNSFSLVPLGAAIGAHLAATWIGGRRPGRNALLAAGLVFAASAPIVAYSLLVFRGDPFWGVVYGRQNVTPTPLPHEVALVLGAVLAFAALGLRPFVATAGAGPRLVLVWIVLAAALMYAPVGFQRRFAFGLHPMLAVVAAVGVARVWSWVGARRAGQRAIVRPILAAVVGAALFGSTLVLYAVLVDRAGDPSGSAEPDGGAFQSRELRDEADWLSAAMGPDDILLADFATANYLAGQVPGRVYVGHWIATLDYADKRRAAERFYREPDAAARRAFLGANEIRFVVYGPRERALAGANPLGLAGLELAFTNRLVEVYLLGSSGPVDDVDPDVAEGRRLD